jgi:hypothetical protein
MKSFEEMCWLHDFYPKYLHLVVIVYYKIGLKAWQVFLPSLVSLIKIWSLAYIVPLKVKYVTSKKLYFKTFVKMKSFEEICWLHDLYLNTLF